MTRYGKIFKVLFRVYSPPHRSTLLCSNVVKFVRIRWNRALFTEQKQKFRLPLKLSLPAPIVPKICQGQPPDNAPQCSRFHSNRFTFGGVIAERVNTAKLPWRANPIFGRSLASSRIISDNVSETVQDRDIAIMED